MALQQVHAKLAALTRLHSQKWVLVVRTSYDPGTHMHPLCIQRLPRNRQTMFVSSTARSVHSTRSVWILMLSSLNRSFNRTEEAETRCSHEHLQKHRDHTVSSLREYLRSPLPPTEVKNLAKYCHSWRRNRRPSWRRIFDLHWRDWSSWLYIRDGVGRRVFVVSSG